MSKIPATPNFASVTDLEFKHAKFDSAAQFVQVISALPRLRRCGILHAVRDWKSHPLTASVCTPSIELADVVISHVYMTSILPWLVSHPWIRRLAVQKLLETKAAEGLVEVLRALGPRLEHIIAHPLASLDFSHITGLRTLEISQIFSCHHVVQVSALLAQLHAPFLRCIVLGFDHWITGDDPNLCDWRRIAGMSLQRVNFLVLAPGPAHSVCWAEVDIVEKLQNRTYALHVRIGHLERTHKYTLAVFDT
ncbi:hypothetical protein C8R44DRAFT_889961 [Mycena epipterygia]|nr:hypothetical protein C8R44DRAFT_889961 [Mycena epipterygia]